MDYKFVKEFAEGVNRMCNELEQVGLKAPVYYTNAFMLQAVIYNTNTEKAGYSDEKLAIGDGKSAIANEKLAIEILKSAIEQQKYNEPTKANILRAYEKIEKNQIFGTKEIEKILGCSSSTARAVMAKLRNIDVVTEVKGRGKGKYIFKIK